MFFQFVFTRCRNGFEAPIATAPIADGDGFAYHSLSFSFQIGNGSGLKHLDTIIRNISPSFKEGPLMDVAYLYCCSIPERDGDSLMLEFNPIPFNPLVKGNWVNRPGAILCQAIVGSVSEFYPFELFRYNKIWKAKYLTQAHYYMAPRTDLPPIFPHWIDEDKAELFKESYITLETLKKFNSGWHADALRKCIAFLIVEYKKRDHHSRKYLVIKDANSENIECWIAAIELAFSPRLASAIPFATRMSAFTTRNVYNTSDGIHYYAMIIGLDASDDIGIELLNTRMDDSNYDVLDAINQDDTFSSELQIGTDDIPFPYYDLVTQFDVEHLRFSKRFLQANKELVQPSDEVVKIGNLYSILFRTVRDFSIDEFNAHLTELKYHWGWIPGDFRSTLLTRLLEVLQNHVLIHPNEINATTQSLGFILEQPDEASANRAAEVITTFVHCIKELLSDTAKMNSVFPLWEHIKQWNNLAFGVADGVFKLDLPQRSTVSVGSQVPASYELTLATFLLIVAAYLQSIGIPVEKNVLIRIAANGLNACESAKDSSSGANILKILPVTMLRSNKLIDILPNLFLELDPNHHTFLVDCILEALKELPRSGWLFKILKLLVEVSTPGLIQHVRDTKGQTEDTHDLCSLFLLVLSRDPLPDSSELPLHKAAELMPILMGHWKDVDIPKNDRGKLLQRLIDRIRTDARRNPNEIDFTKFALNLRDIILISDDVKRLAELDDLLFPKLYALACKQSTLNSANEIWTPFLTVKPIHDIVPKFVTWVGGTPRIVEDVGKLDWAQRISFVETYFKCVQASKEVDTGFKPDTNNIGDLVMELCKGVPGCKDSVVRVLKLLAPPILSRLEIVNVTSRLLNRDGKVDSLFVVDYLITAIPEFVQLVLEQGMLIKLDDELGGDATKDLVQCIAKCYEGISCSNLFFNAAIYLYAQEPLTAEDTAKHLPMLIEHKAFLPEVEFDTHIEIVKQCVRDNWWYKDFKNTLTIMATLHKWKPIEHDLAKEFADAFTSFVYKDPSNANDLQVLQLVIDKGNDLKIDVVRIVAKELVANATLSAKMPQLEKYGAKDMEAFVNIYFDCFTHAYPSGSNPKTDEIGNLYFVANLGLQNCDEYMTDSPAGRKITNILVRLNAIMSPMCTLAEIACNLIAKASGADKIKLLRYFFDTFKYEFDQSKIFQFLNKLSKKELKLLFKCAASYCLDCIPSPVLAPGNLQRLLNHIISIEIKKIIDGEDNKFVFEECDRKLEFEWPVDVDVKELAKTIQTEKPSSAICRNSADIYAFTLLEELCDAP